MKYLLLLVLTISLSDAFEYKLTPKKIVEEVYCFFGKVENINKENAGNMVNSCFVQTKEGFIVIDSGPTYSYASQAYEQMQKIARIPVKYVINTHDHDDHWLGNSFYKNKGALLIGPQTYKQNVIAGRETRMHRILGDVLYGKTSIVKLDKIVDNNLTIITGEKELYIKKLVQRAHTKGDLIVYIPAQKVLFAGDLVFNDRLTSLRDGSLLGSLEALEKIDAYGAKVIVGGHGYRTDENATKVLKKYLTVMKKEVQEALDNDITIDKVTKKVNMLEFKTMKLYKELHSRNVFEAYQELELYDEEEEE